MELPLGEKIAPVNNIGLPQRQLYQGRVVRLSPLDPVADGPGLYACSHGSREQEAVWAYLNYGPFADQQAMGAWLETCAVQTDPLFFTVRTLAPDEPVGMVSFLALSPADRCLELGHIWYGSQVQRTKVNTETIYLMLCQAFDQLHYRRVEWKCNALNEKSRAAALRLGFQYEGLFRQHRIVKGRNRDTAWYALLDGDWPNVKAHMERWLYGTEESLSLRQLNGG
ncbi:MAG: GNAT family N-acetyltransferase [Candidatus Latescibacteria bacterium]|nr:GNAT family N-acetyltransferase [Candidatus Latescibacterota bacterium]